jgi:hypothetical protein
MPMILENIAETIVSSDHIFGVVEESVNDELQNSLEDKKGYIELNEESPIIAIWFSEGCSNLDFPFGDIRFDVDASTEELARQKKIMREHYEHHEYNHHRHKRA